MRKAFAILINIFPYFPLMLAALSGAAISSWILDRNFYVDLLSSDAIYDALFIGEIALNMENDPAGANQASAPAFAAAMRELISKDYLRGEALRMVNTAFDLIEGRTTEAILYLDARPIKEALAGEGAGRFARTYVANLPVCVSGQTWSSDFGNLPGCIPDNLSTEELEAQIRQILSQGATQQPDRIEFGEFTTPPELIGGEVFAGLSAGIVTLLMMAGVFWIVAALVASDRWRTRLYWLGLSLIVPALLVMGIGFSVLGQTARESDFIQMVTPNRDNPYSPETEAALWSVAQQAVTHVANSFIIVGGIAGFSGVVLLLIGSRIPVPAESMEKEKRKRGQGRVVVPYDLPPDDRPPSADIDDVVQKL